MPAPIGHHPHGRLTAWSRYAGQLVWAALGQQLVVVARVVAGPLLDLAVAILGAELAALATAVLGAKGDGAVVETHCAALSAGGVAHEESEVRGQESDVSKRRS